MSATFRAGDRVKVVSYDSLGTESTNVGRTGTVSDMDSEYIFVNMDDVEPDEVAEPFYADELELVEAAPVNVPADPDAEPQPYDMPSPEASALDRIAAAMTEDNGPWPRAASPDCGVCDGILRPAEEAEWWTCSACGSAHTSRDCCESRFERIAAILRETGRL